MTICKVRIVSAIITTMLLSACAVNPSNEAPNHEQRAALSFEPDPTKAILYLYRPFNIVNSGVNSSFRINDERLGELKSGYFRVALKPGKHLIRVFIPSWIEEDYYSGESKDGGKRTLIRAKAGEILYLRYTTDPSRFQWANPGPGQRELRELDLYSAGFEYMDKVYESPEDIAWKKCEQQNSLAVCNEFLSKYPKGEYVSQVRQVIENIQIEQQNEKLRSAFARDEALPVQVRKDKYMVALTTRLKNENFSEALVYFEQLEGLGVELSPSFQFFYGEALIQTGEIERGISKLYGYLKQSGSSGKYYNKALELINDAEESNF